MSEIKEVTAKRSEIVTYLSDYNYSRVCSMVSLTPVQMNQYLDYWIITPEGKKKKNPTPTPNPFMESGIFLFARKYKIFTGFNYKRAIVGRLEKEGKEAEFEVGESWHKQVSLSLVTDKATESKYYFRYQYVEDSILEMDYLHNGNAIDRRLFEGYITKKSDEYVNQGLDNPLRIQVCNLQNILELTLDGVRYKLVD